MRKRKSQERMEVGWRWDGEVQLCEARDSVGGA
jgi:hypothetical protein